MNDTRILVVKPKTLSAADKKLLRESGVVCVEAEDPASVRLLSAEAAPMTANELFYAAIEAIAKDKYSNNTAETFARNLAVMAKASQGLDP